tara:strand:- start:747 stop:1037 length:291 start_codon:yes stop_codon:yes gene_type:complete
MFNVSIESNISTPTVVTTTDRGMNAEEWAELAVKRIVDVSMDAPMPLREQALAYQKSIKALLIDYFYKVARSERATIKVILEKQGHADIAKNIEDI